LKIPAPEGRNLSLAKNGPSPFHAEPGHGAFLGVNEGNMFRMTKRRWAASVVAIVAIFVMVHIVGIARRNARYRRVLKEYSDVLKPGMKRSEVENYFIMSKYVSFGQGCCVGPKRGAS